MCIGWNSDEILRPVRRHLNNFPLKRRAGDLAGPGATKWGGSSDDCWISLISPVARWQVGVAPFAAHVLPSGRFICIISPDGKKRRSKNRNTVAILDECNEAADYWSQRNLNIFLAGKIVVKKKVVRWLVQCSANGISLQMSMISFKKSPVWNEWGTDWMKNGIFLRIFFKKLEKIGKISSVDEGVGCKSSASFSIFNESDFHGCRTIALWTFYQMSFDADFIRLIIWLWIAVNWRSDCII